LLTVTNLRKSFYHRPVLNDLNLQIAAGEIIALMGKNGVGKSTLLRILGRISTANSGEVKFAGKSLLKGDSENRRGILYLGHAPGMYPPLSAKENLGLFSRLYKSPTTEPGIEEVLEIVGLTKQADDPIRIYSQGMLQRLKLALAMLIDWKLLLFDEPFTGLDEQGRELVEKILRQWQSTNRTILLVTHDFEWSWQFCHRLVVINRGTIQYNFNIAETDINTARDQFRHLLV